MKNDMQGLPEALEMEMILTAEKQPGYLRDRTGDERVRSSREIRGTVYPAL